MPRNQHTSPLPSDSAGREDIMSAGPRDPDTMPGDRETSLLGPGTSGR